MLFRTVPFDVLHLMEITPQDSQVMEYQMVMAVIGNMSNHETSLLEQTSLTMMGDDVPLGCAGIVQSSKDTGSAWSFFSDLVNNAMMPPIHRAVVCAIESSPYKRIEMSVRTDFNPGHRWARMLGFNLEGDAGRYEPNGDDYCLYSRIRS